MPIAIAGARRRGGQILEPDSTMTATDTALSTDPRLSQLEQLRARYRHLRPAVLAALAALVLDPNISLDDAKAQTAMHGVLVTAASMIAARSLCRVAPGRRPGADDGTEAPIDAEAPIKASWSGRQARHTLGVCASTDAARVLRQQLPLVQLRWFGANSSNPIAQHDQGHLTPPTMTVDTCV